MTSQEISERPKTGSSISPGPGPLRQLGNGIGGLVVLLLSGLILMIVVLMTSR